MSDTAKLDREFVWHPYDSKSNPGPVRCAASGEGASILLEDGTRLLDGISSWWCAAHGHRPAPIIAAVEKQLQELPHVMFAGFTHAPAAKLAAKLAELTPGDLHDVFFLDSGSVAVEAALKMALQYQHAKGRDGRKRFLTVRGGYHGDTTGAMSLCDPVEGMHTVFSGFLPRQLFAEQPRCLFGDGCSDADFAPMRELLETHRDEVAAVILEPIFQGASAMYFYDPGYLVKLRELCTETGTLLIFDEIATGFGRTGKRFAADHAHCVPDIMTVGKGLTGGVITLACAITTREVSRTISSGAPGVFLHGPTFMANPLACAAANASLEMFDSYDYLGNALKIEAQLQEELAPARNMPHVRDVRALGAIGVIEFDRPADTAAASDYAVRRGVWLRPFGRWLYTMPPFVTAPDELSKITSVMLEIASGKA